MDLYTLQPLEVTNSNLGSKVKKPNSEPDVHIFEGLQMGYAQQNMH